MSNSARAKERRCKRSRLTKHQRGALSRQHWGDLQGQKGLKEKEDRAERDRLGILDIFKLKQ